MVQIVETNFNGQRVEPRNFCLFDENVPHEFAGAFSRIGYQPSFVSVLFPGRSDVEVLALAKKRGELLVTRDKSDYGALVFRDGLSLRSGILVLRDPVATADISTLYEEQLAGCFSSFSTDHFRQRQMPAVRYVVETGERVDRSSKAKTKIVGQVGVTFDSNTATTS